MLMSELICKKRDGGRLEREEIEWMVREYTRGAIPDYQMSAMLMAICWRGMDEEETVQLTLAMRDSGDVMDLSAVEGVKADKHSTGGVGDKVSILLCPMLAACGVKMAKLSGRGLGHTGGTIDKLESIPGFSCSLDRETFLENVNRVGCAIGGQTGNICPADKKLYALRDVTGTVPSRALIVSSIMSKKLASGADIIVLDVKTGSGAFMQREQAALELCRAMVEVGRRAGKKVMAVLSDMDEPLGYAVGNALEVKEVIEALQGRGPEDLMEVCLCLGSLILEAAGFAAHEEEGKSLLRRALDSGAALEKFREFVRAQGGDERVTEDAELLPRAPVQLEVPAPQTGWLTGVDAEKVGLVSLHLGGGRTDKDSPIDPAVGLVMRKKVGQAVTEGECLAVIHGSSEEKARAAAQLLLKACRIGGEPPVKAKLIRSIVK